MEASESAPGRPRGRPRAWHDRTEQNTIRSLDRAMAVFERLSEIGSATLSAIAADTGQSAATVYRILVTLEGRGMVEFDTETQTWAVGTQAFVIGARFLRRTSLVDRARPVLRDLMEATGETANLGIERGGRVLFVAQAETHENIRAFFPPGTLSPMHSSGIGKAILAHLPDAVQARLIDATAWERFTPHTLVGAAALRADLALTRTRGYALDGEEKNIGMTCLAAPVFDAFGGVAGGLSISGPTSRMSGDKRPAHAEAVVAAARRLTTAIGGV